MSSGLDVFMSKDQKARQLLMEAWLQFSRDHQADFRDYIRDYIHVDSEDELDEIDELAEKIIRGTS